MAGDWIKVRTGLADDPAVIAIAYATRLDVDSVVGKLHRIWSWADGNTTDGHLAGVPPSWIDGLVKKKGFADAMAATSPPWLVIHASGVTIPDFSRHNGEPAKSRAMDTRRKQMSRNCPPDNRTKAGHSSDRNGTREEKRRVIAPAHGGVDWGETRKKANDISKALGRCTSQRDRRLVLASCALSQIVDGGADWLEISLRETKEARPGKPYAYLTTVLSASASFDFKATAARLEIPDEMLNGTGG